MSARKSSHRTIFLIVSNGSPLALIASSLRSTSKKPVCPMTRSLHPPMAHCRQRVRFAATWREKFFEVPLSRKFTPVTLPPGRLRLATRPALTGSAVTANTIGMAVVAALAARAVASPPIAAITDSWRRTRSAAKVGQTVVLTLCPAVLEDDITAFDVTDLAQALVERGEARRICVGRQPAEIADDRRGRPLRARRKRPSRRRTAAKQDDEIAPSYT